MFMTLEQAENYNKVILEANPLARMYEIGVQFIRKNKIKYVEHKRKALPNTKMSLNFLNLPQSILSVVSKNSRLLRQHTKSVVTTDLSVKATNKYVQRTVFGWLEHKPHGTQRNISSGQIKGLI
jgi:hypothetical protein